MNVFSEFAAVAERFAMRPAVIQRRRNGSATCTYAELGALAERVAALIRSSGGTAGSRCAILADNSAHWCATYLGILRLGAVAVPLDTAYSAAQVRTLLADSAAELLFTSERYLAAAREAVSSLPAAPEIILMSGPPFCGAADLRGRTAADSGSPLPSCAATPSDPAVILYTSGTTSDPKGVVLTHGNLLAEKEAVFRIVTVNERDSVLGVLPLFHALAQVANLLLPFAAGACVVFLETVNTTEMMRAFSELKITAFCVVPQFYYLLHGRVMERVKASPWPLRASFRVLLAFNGWCRQGMGINLGRLLFGQAHKALGGRMRLLVCGGSRLDPQVGRDLYRMGFNIIQAYGLTECSGAATVTRSGESRVDTVGQALPGVEVRISQEPDAPQGDGSAPGEILLKGPIVMAGYHRRPDADALTLRDGWLHTGDLGFLDGSGRLSITGRKKEVIVLASGKNIYPEEIEAHYLQSPSIKEIAVMGISLPGEPAAERLHAIVVPDFDALRERRVVNTREMIRFEIEGLSLQLPSHKRVLSFDVWLQDLPRTTTLKLKRHEIERMFLRRRAEAAEPAEAADWSDADQAWGDDPHVERAMTVIRAAAKAGTAVRPDTNLELDLGLDSMERVELLSSLEHAFGVKVPDGTAQRIYTVRDLVEGIRPAGGITPLDSNGRIDPWIRLLAKDPVDPVLSSLLKPKHIFAPFAFLVMRSAHLLARVLLGLRVSGREHIPPRGPFLLSPNHTTYLDAFLLVSALPWRNFRNLFFVGASEYFATPFMRRLAQLINVVPVDPDANLVRAMQAGAYGLRHRRVLVLFPEGERSPDGTVRTFKKGAAILSRHLDAPVVPVAIQGVFEIWPRSKRLQCSALRPWGRPRARIRFGPPLSAAVHAAPDEANGYAAFTGALRNAVIELIRRDAFL